MRRVLAVLVSIGLGIGTIALATPAQAANTPSTLYGKCDNNTITVYSDSAGTQPVTSVTATNPNSFWVTLTLEFLAPVNCTGTKYEVWDGSFWRDGGLPGYDADDTFSQYLDPQFVPNVGYRILGDANTEVLVTINYNDGGGGDDPGSSSASGSAPASEIQQFGLPASGNCEDGVNEAMNWSGVGMDGWGISWAQWMNEGAGGAVCTRTVVYDTATAKWVVN